ncbi:MAG: Grx4 family monothiol glutaredoxin [Armatimonadota bacterium]|nr:Grx4 family monothiol glutaredoxin [Armatimonadota bacterium]
MVTEHLKERFEKETKTSPVVIYMKGTPDFPMCGFSRGAVEALEAVGAPITYVNVLQDPEAWEGIKEYSGWPTIPQIFVGGKFVGGCDIVREMWQSGELNGLVNEATGPK